MLNSDTNNGHIDLSLCIPTNGIIEWVVPVIDSIYAEKEPNGRFEVIVTDNGSNAEFAKLMQDYRQKHDNFVYKRTDSFQFLNQIEAFKLAKGNLIKFVNHRAVLKPGALNILLEFARGNSDYKPGIFFLNGVNILPICVNEYNDFDGYVKALSYGSSWSGGTAIWKSDFEKINLNRKFNKLFPHTDIIFYEKTKKKYIINNEHLMDDIPADSTKKGKYDLFYAFAVEYVGIIKGLYDSRYITKDTFDYVKSKNEDFVALLYLEHVLRKKPCSYDLSSFEKSVDVYYSKNRIKRKAINIAFRKAIHKILRGNFNADI